MRQRGDRRPVGKLSAQSNPFLAADAATQGEGNPPKEKRAWEHPKENCASPAAAVPKRVRISAEKSLLGESQSFDNQRSVNVTPTGATAAELRELEAQRLAAEAAVKADFAARRAAEEATVNVAASVEARSAGPASLAQQRLQPDGGGALLAAEEMRRWLQRGAPAAGSACRSSGSSPAAAVVGELRALPRVRSHGCAPTTRRQPETIQEYKCALLKLKVRLPPNNATRQTYEALWLQATARAPPVPKSPALIAKTSAEQMVDADPTATPTENRDLPAAAPKRVRLSTPSGELARRPPTPPPRSAESPLVPSPAPPPPAPLLPTPPPIPRW